MTAPAVSFDHASRSRRVLSRMTTNPIRTLAFAGAAFFVGQAITIANGSYAQDAIMYLSLAGIAALAGAFAPPSPLSAWQVRRILAIAMAAGLAVELGDLLVDSPGIYLRPVASPHPMATYQRGLAVAAVAVGIAVADRRRISWVALIALVSAHFVIGRWMIQSSPEPHIDVYYFQREASEALLHGVNPYTITFPNIYGDSTPYYGPGMSVGGRLQFGFPYPPLSLFLALPGHLAGDYRYAQLLAMDLAGIIMGSMSGAGIGVLAAAVYLFTPRSFFVLEQGWTEPFAVLLVSAVTWCAVRRLALLPYVVGILFAVKQYMILAVGPTLLLSLELAHRLRDEGHRSGVPSPASPRPIITVARFFAIALAVTLILTLPLALWNWRPFFHSVVALQFFQPFRDDALSYLVSLTKLGGPPLPSSIAFIAAFLATGLSLWRLPRSPEGFAGALALVFFAFFAFNKQAFANYYFFLIGTFCCAVAAAPGLTSAPGSK
jgi:hypothetical protein